MNRTPSFPLLALGSAALLAGAGGCMSATEYVELEDGGSAEVSDAGGSTDAGQAVLDAGNADQDAGPAVDGGSALPHFSFFVTSLVAMRELSGSSNGFGGDLRYGETGAGAGIRGADKICTAVAERSMPGSSVKVWRAFLSASSDGNGQQVNAIDRIGQGPWYDRTGRLVASAKNDLLSTRPATADLTIRDDLPNEDGIPNHQPDPTQAQVDNHDVLTGSNAQGRLDSSSATCSDWTSSSAMSNGAPKIGHSWPRGRPGPGPGGGTEDPLSWSSAHSAPGCAAGINLTNLMDDGTHSVGGSGGYGAIYCFALSP
jgi:hypothetical protein